MIRRFGDIPQKGQQYVLRQGVYAILTPDFDPRGKVLLTSQYDNPPDLQLPGGGVDPGESPLAALHREVYEETGWRISRPKRLGAFRRFVYMPEYDQWAEKLCTVYIAQPSRLIGPAPEADHVALWLSAPEAAQKLGNPGDRHFMARFCGMP